MALKAIIDYLESVDEGVRALYRKVDAPDDPLAGKFVLDIEAVDGWVLAPAVALTTALGVERARREKAEASLAAFDGIGPGEVLTLKTDIARLSALDPLHHADLLAAEKVEVAKSELRREAAVRAEEAERRHRRLLDRLHDLLVTGPATAAASRLGGNAALLMPIVEAQTRVRELASGEVVVEVLDPAGVARIKDAFGALLSVDDLVAEMSRADDFAPLFSGGGGGGGGVAPSAENPWRREAWNVTAQHRLMRETPIAAERLKAEAGVAPSARNPWRRDQWNVTEQMRAIRSDPAGADRLRREAGVTA